MKKKLLWLVPLTIIGSLLLVACGSDDEEVAAPAAPAPQGKSEPVAGGVATAVVPTAAPAAAAPTARPAPKQDKSAPGAAMYQDGSSIADILAGPAIGDIDSEKFNKDRFGGTLRWVPQGNVPNLDGMLSGTAVGRGVSWHFWESLAQWDGSGALKGDLADVWTIAEDSDGAHYSFTLRDGRSWHDGGQPTSEDVKASFARYLGKDGSFGPSIKDRLKGGTVDSAFEIVNDDQFVIHLTEPTGLLLMALGYVGGTQPQIMPKATVDKYMTELA
ncbi:MAG: ABC transporter substrate-binding protein, partial [Dehalococcoidia bacterium]